MLEFFRHLFANKQEAKQRRGSDTTSDTFVEATGGGWGDPPNVVAADGGSQKSYVTQQLELASQEALQLEVGESFHYILKNIPAGIESPHEIIFGMIMRASEYGLSHGVASNERIRFTRIS